jgi:hypothetical protein
MLVLSVDSLLNNQAVIVSLYHLLWLHYVIKFVNDLQQVGGFLRVLRFPPPIKLTATI